MTTTAAAKLDAIFPELAAISAERKALDQRKPVADETAMVAWVQESRSLSRKLTEAWKATKGLICQRCGGQGHYFASNNRPIPCQCRDGWTAKGRKLYAGK